MTIQHHYTKRCEVALLLMTPVVVMLMACVTFFALRAVLCRSLDVEGARLVPLLFMIAAMMSQYPEKDPQEEVEQQPEELTRTLATADNEIRLLRQQLEEAASSLQRSQDGLLRAERMAALGRLATGLAHEMNTPLAASLSALKVANDLVREYEASIADPAVTVEDHRQIASELRTHLHAIRQWMEQVAAYTRSLKLHTADLRSAEEKPFFVEEVLEDVQLLLAHRLRQAQCTLTVSCVGNKPVVRGDASKLGQVLTNIVANTIDAYDGVTDRAKEIVVTMEDEHDALAIHVGDAGCGIAREHIDKIFDEFFSTKPLSEGSGLGLSIARDIMTKAFHGTITVESTLGRGSVFTVRLPHPRVEN